MNSERIMARRALLATAIVVAALLAVPLVGAAIPTSDRAVRAAECESGLHIGEINAATDPADALETLVSANGPTGEIPPALRDELFVFPNAEDPRANDDGSVVSYVVNLPQGDAWERLKTEMEARGWSTVPLGNLCGATFVKEGGACTWTLATCTQVAERTVIVFRSVIR